MANLTDVNTNFFATASETYTNNLSASISAGEDIVPVNSANEYLDGEIVVLTVEPGTTNEATFTGVKASSPDRFINCKWTEGNVGVGHASGSTIIDYDSATHFNMLSKGIQKFADQDANLRATAIQAALGVSTTAGIVNPPGIISPYAGYTAPSGWFMCNGQEVSRIEFDSLFNTISPVIGNLTISIGSNAIGTIVNHGLSTGDPIHLTTTGSLPTGLNNLTLYYAIKVDVNTFRFATSAANANAGTAITTSGTQSGSHTLRLSPYGVGNGSTTFNIPDLKGRTVVSLDSSQSEFESVGKTGGAKTHTLTAAQIPNHVHGTAKIASNYGLEPGHAGYSGSVLLNSAAGDTSGRTGNPIGTSGQSHNNLQPYISLNYIIKS